MLLPSVHLGLLLISFAMADEDTGRGGDNLSNQDNMNLMTASAMTTGVISSEAPTPVTSPPNASNMDILPTSSTGALNDTTSYTGMNPMATSPTLAILFSPPSNTTTCTAVTFRWNVTSSSADLTDVDLRLFITNDGVQQSSPCMPSSSMPHGRRQLPSAVVSLELTNKTSLVWGEFHWPAVTVPKGWYVLEAFPINTLPSDIGSKSAPFFVMAGPNTTCVHPNASTSSAALSSAPSGISAGALVGTIVGTVVGLTALLGAFALPRLWRRGVPEHKAWKARGAGLYLLF